MGDVRKAKTLSSKVPVQYKHATLIEYLIGRYTYLDRETWLERIAEGRFQFEGKLASAETQLHQGGIVTYDVPAFPQPDANFDYSIVYEDEWLLGINKPPNLRVHGEGRYMMANLSYHLWYSHEPPYPEAKLINRLDTDTSGVVLFAKDSDTAREMGWLFERKQVDKTYLALVYGMPRRAKGVIDQPIGKVDNPKYRKKGRVPRSIVNAPKSRDAVTGYEVVETFSAEKPPILKRVNAQLGIGNWELDASRVTVSLVRLSPKTGRTHQLRVHLAWMGHPIVGDRLYMLDDERYVQWREARDSAEFADLQTRQALHSSETSFLHPMTQQRVTISAPLAADMQSVLDQLR